MPPSTQSQPSSGSVSHVVYTILLLISNMAYFGASLVLSHTTHSLTLRMDSNYVLFVVGSLIVSLMDLRLRNARSVKHTFGWARLEFLGNLFNATFLASLSFSSAVESVQQIIHLSGHGADAHGMHQVLTVIVMGAVRCILGTLTFGTRYAIRDSCRNFRVSYTQNAGVELCVEGPVAKKTAICITDAASDNTVRVQNPPVIYPTLGVAVMRELIGPLSILVCGVIYVFYGHRSWCFYVDPIICLLQVLILGLTMFRPAKESGLALMLTIPTHIDIHAVQNRLLEKFPTIQNVHDFHLWRTSRYHIIVTCHIVCSSLLEYMGISSAIEVFFYGEGISEVTIQPEVFKTATSDPQEGATMSPDACRCCDKSPKCCSLTGAGQPHDVRKRIVERLPDETAELEIPDSRSNRSHSHSHSRGGNGVLKSE